jgi:hypothetical protein
LDPESEPILEQVPDPEPNLGPLFSSSDLSIRVLPESIPDLDPVPDPDPATDPGPLFFLIDLRIKVLIKMLWIQNTAEVYKNYQQNFISMPI